MREIYLPAFEAVVKTGRSLVGDGVVQQDQRRLMPRENRWLLTDVLKTEWGFKGFVVSDWGATHIHRAGGQCRARPRNARPADAFRREAEEGVAKAGEVTPAQIDENARRMVRLIVRSGAIDRGTARKVDARMPRACREAQRAAEEAIVLLKNAGVLPLDPRIKSLAVIGPNADVVRIQGGGSSAVVPFDVVTPLQALRAALPGVNDHLYPRRR
jgi:beta-glucosidase